MFQSKHNCKRRSWKFHILLKNSQRLQCSFWLVSADYKRGKEWHFLIKLECSSTPVENLETKVCLWTNKNPSPSYNRIINILEISSLLSQFLVMKHQHQHLKVLSTTCQKQKRNKMRTLTELQQNGCWSQPLSGPSQTPIQGSQRNFSEQSRASKRGISCFIMFQTTPSTAHTNESLPWFQSTVISGKLKGLFFKRTGTEGGDLFIALTKHTRAEQQAGCSLSSCSQLPAAKCTSTAKEIIIYFTSKAPDMQWMPRDRISLQPHGMCSTFRCLQTDLCHQGNSLSAITWPQTDLCHQLNTVCLQSLGHTSCSWAMWAAFLQLLSRHLLPAVTRPAWPLTWSSQGHAASKEWSAKDIPN